MSELVFIEGLKVSAVIGVYDWERHIEQNLLIDLELEADIQQSGHTDEVADTIDYSVIAEQVQSIARRGEYRLLEALAENVCKYILTIDKLLSVKITIRKPSAIRHANAVGVVFKRYK